MSPSISVVVVAYHSGERLLRFLDSLDDDLRAGVEAVVVDHGAEGTEIERAAAIDGVRIVTPGSNRGFGAGCNRGAEAALGQVLVFLNPDTIVAPGAVRALAEAAVAPGVGIAMARLRLLEEPELLNSGGNVVHVSGLAWAGGFREPAGSIEEVEQVPFPSGAAMAMSAALFHELGGFTEELFLYLEDLELGWRARLHGLAVVVTPAADVYHDYDYGRNPRKQYFIERNRLVFVLASYSPRLLAAAAPVLLAAELGMIALAARERWLTAKLAGWIWCVRRAGWLARHRRATQRLRRAPDSELVRYLTPVLDPKMIGLPAGTAAANRLMAAYWSLARRLV